MLEIKRPSRSGALSILEQEIMDKDQIVGTAKVTAPDNRGAARGGGFSNHSAGRGRRFDDCGTWSDCAELGADKNVGALSYRDPD
jgi:hypothetical protein